MIVDCTECGRTVDTAHAPGLPRGYRGNRCWRHSEQRERQRAAGWSGKHRPARRDEPLDEVLIERLVGGTIRVDPFEHSRERREAIRRMAAARMNDREIAERLDTTRDAIAHLRKRHGIPAGLPATRAAGSWRAHGVGGRRAG